ncbi:MAG: TraR/DksA family transcriptional regulator [Phycisphaerae bacterium]|nr:TraR/DksA family transcriptional regulator [Phycisphaerae bacterium]
MRGKSAVVTTRRAASSNTNKSAARGNVAPGLDREWVIMMRDSLVRRRNQILAALRSNRDQLAGAQRNYADIGDRASEGFEDEIAAGLLSIESDQLDEIEGALDRIAAGTFGACIDCGKPIPRKRLEVLPFAKRCLSCEGQKERHVRAFVPSESTEESDLD